MIPSRSLLLPSNPKVWPALHNISKHCSSQENHVFTLGGSLIQILNFCQRIRTSNALKNMRKVLTFSLSGSPLSTQVRYSCFISFSRRLGRPGYMLDPPERTTCLYSSERTSTAAAWIVWKSISRQAFQQLVQFALSKGRMCDLPATPGCSTSTRWGWNIHSGASNRSEPILITRPSGSYGQIS